MKFLKILLLLVAIVLLGSILLSVGGWFMLRGTPEWYRPSTATAEQRQASAQRAEQMLVKMTNWAGGARAARLRAAAAADDSPTTAQAATALAAEPSKPFQIQFTDDELTSVFEKWTEGNGRRAVFEQYVEDPRLVLRDNQLILAGSVKDLGTVVSMQFEPHIDEQGNLQLKIARVLGGILPLPDALWSRKRDRIEHLLESKLPAYQQEAAIAPDGTANAAAAAAGMNKLLLATLRGESADPVLFVPYDVKKLNRSVPVKITAVSIDNNTLTVTAEQMTNEERAALLNRLKTPPDTATASAR